MVDAIGWIGNLLLSTCAIPLVIDVWKRGADKVSVPFLLYWFVGEIFAIIFAIIKAPKPQLIANYTLNIILILLVLGMVWKKSKR